MRQHIAPRGNLWWKSSVVALVFGAVAVMGGSSSLACYQCVANTCQTGYFSGAASCSMVWEFGPDGERFRECQPTGNCAFWILTSGSTPSLRTSKNSASNSMPGERFRPARNPGAVWLCLETKDLPQFRVPSEVHPLESDHPRSRGLRTEGA